jgi:parvulin-like peptidyl-prolyl isomerase
MESKMTLARAEHLKRLVEDKLLLLEARQQKLEVTDAQVTERAKQEVDTLRSQFASEQDFEKQLAVEHLTRDDLLQQRERLLREQLLRQRLMQGKLQEFSLGAEATDEQLKNYYDQHRDEFKRRARVHLSQIFIARPDPGLSADAFTQQDNHAKRRAEEALLELEHGKSFAAVARAYSEHKVTAEHGGDMGWVEQGEVGMPEFDRVVFDRLKVGERSRIVSTGRGYFIVRVEERQESGFIPFEEVRGRIRQQLANQGSEARYQTWIESLKAKYAVVYTEKK